MSSTNRGGGRAASDYYVTPIKPIEEFLRAWHVDSPEAFVGIKRILDPCAGGTRDNQGAIKVSMSYPKAISYRQLLFSHVPTVETVDIRPDSPAQWCADYLIHNPVEVPNLIISNPPFALASEFIVKALRDVKPGGYVVFLLRLNFFGSQKRKAFMQSNPPAWAYVHSERMSFTSKGQDSIEYMHAIWRSGYKATETILKVI